MIRTAATRQAGSATKAHGTDDHVRARILLAPVVRDPVGPVVRARHHRGAAGRPRGPHLPHRDADRAGRGVAGPDRAPLFYALLLKDLGCSSNAARLCRVFGADDRRLKHDHKLTDWTAPLPNLAYALRNARPEASPFARVLRAATIGVTERGVGREMTQARCDRGAGIASRLGFTAATQEAIRSLDEHWDGRGMPLGLRGHQIPLLGRIVGLAQTVEVFASTFSVDAAMAVALERRGTWFDPLLVDVAPLVPARPAVLGGGVGLEPRGDTCRRWSRRSTRCSRPTTPARPDRARRSRR